MVGSWPCKVSSEIHINGRRISELVHEDKGKTTATELEDEKDHEVVRPVYSRLTSATTMVIDRRENSSNHS
jgi:hypothetical protein